jgi:hypothetical protein
VARNFEHPLAAARIAENFLGAEMKADQNVVSFEKFTRFADQSFPLPSEDLTFGDRIRIEKCRGFFRFPLRRVPRKRRPSRAANLIRFERRGQRLQRL